MQSALWSGAIVSNTGRFMQHRLQLSDAKDIEDFEWGLEELGPAEDCYENSKHSLQTVW